MANLYADGNGVLASELAQEFRMIVGDRAFIGNHPVLEAGYIGSQIVNARSVTAKTEGINAGLVAGTATAAENTEVTPTNFVFDDWSVTVARHSLAREVTDQLAMFASSGQMSNPQLFVVDALGSWQQALMNKIITAGQAFTNDVSTTGVDLTVAKLLEAKDTIIANTGSDALGNFMCVLHPQQFADIRVDLMNSGSYSNAIEDSMEAYAAQYSRATGYKGTFFGIDVYTSSKVPTANAAADRRGFMVAPQGLAWNTARIMPKADDKQLIIGDGLVEVGFDFVYKKASSEAYYNYWMGASVGNDDCGVLITTDA